MNLSTMRAALVAVVLAGCVGEADPELVPRDAPGEASSAIVGENALNFNALNFNALNFNALNFNALNFNALSPQNLAALQDPGPSGDLARQLLRYLASCALGRGQSFEVQWTDAAGAAHEESYPGELGLAPGWSTGPLELEGQHMVSACLAARTNYYEVPVLISLRSTREPLRSMTNEPELEAYPEVEGAFWGNLFAPQPYVNACFKMWTVGNSRSWQRDCAVGHMNPHGKVEECGIIHIVGPCNHVCLGPDEDGGHYLSCFEHPGVNMDATSDVITTGLPRHGGGQGNPGPNPGQPDDDDED